MSDAQFEERERTHAQRAHQLQRDKEQLEASNARLTRMVGELTMDKRALQEELQAAGEADRKLVEIRKYVTEAFGASQISKPVSLVLQRIYALLEGEEVAKVPADDVKDGAA